MVLLHEGGFQTGSYSACTGMSGPIVEIAQHLSHRIDAVIAGHAHQPYVWTIDDPKGFPARSPVPCRSAGSSPR